MDGLTHTVGSHSGSTRHYKMHQPGGGLEKKLIGQYDHSGRAHEFAYRSSYKGKHTHAHERDAEHHG